MNRILTMILLITTIVFPAQVESCPENIDAKYIRDLIGLLGNRDLMVADYAIKELTRIGQPAIQPLIEAIHSRDLGTKGNAAKCLGLMGTEVPCAIPSLIISIGTAEDIEPEFINLIFDIFKQVGAPAISSLALALYDEREFVADLAAAIITELGITAKEIAPLLALGLNDHRDLVRIRFARILADISPLTQSIQPSLISALNDTNIEVRRFACEALGNYSRIEEKGVLKLKEMLMDMDYRTRLAAAYALVKLYPDDGHSMRCIIDSSKCGFFEVRAQALHYIGRIGLNQDTLILFENAIRSFPDCLYEIVINSLVNAITPKSCSNLDLHNLENLLKDFFLDERVISFKPEIGYIIAHISDNPEYGVSILINQLKNEDNHYIVGNTIILLGDLGSKAASALQALNEILNDEKVEAKFGSYDYMIKINAIEAIGKIKKALPIATNALKAGL